MSQARTGNVATRVRDDERLDRAMMAARRRVILLHRLAGVPLVIREGDAMVEVDPETVDLPDEDAPVRQAPAAG